IVVTAGYSYPAMGAGLLITPNYGIPAIITLTNTLIGDNALHVGINAPVSDDCYGKVRAKGYNLIETMAHCQFEGPSIGDVLGIDPKLGPLQLNGGSTLTQSPLPGSPAIDAGRPTGCTDDLGALLTIDQRGWRRPIGSHCDIGAVEYSPFAIDLPLVRR
ncbi:MAG TPA: choice-of-anchor Q domain-containing protein, partial [Anaerolineae bacterium]|nr:choice-of-anchor Q domain-containing protein [Anaerolineae bacterium]